MYWFKCKQKDGSIIDQKARLSGLSQEERDNCKEFRWVNEETGHSVAVNLENGLFAIEDADKQQILHAGWGDIGKLSYKEGVAYRLIYATRHFVDSHLGEQEDSSLHLIGWQFTEQGKNYTRILYVCQNGEIIFSGD